MCECSSTKKEKNNYKTTTVSAFFNEIVCVLINWRQNAFTHTQRIKTVHHISFLFLFFFLLIRKFYSAWAHKCRVFVMYMFFFIVDRFVYCTCVSVCWCYFLHNFSLTLLCAPYITIVSYFYGSTRSIDFDMGLNANGLVRKNGKHRKIKWENRQNSKRHTIGAYSNDFNICVGITCAAAFKTGQKKQIYMHLRWIAIKMKFQLIATNSRWLRRRIYFYTIVAHRQKSKVYAFFYKIPKLNKMIHEFDSINDISFLRFCFRVNKI